MKLPKNRRGDTSKGKATPSKTAVKRKTKKVVSGGRPGSRGGRKAGSSFKKTKVKSVSEMAQITKVKKREAIALKRKAAAAKAVKKNKEKIQKLKFAKGESQAQHIAKTNIQLAKATKKASKKKAELKAKIAELAKKTRKRKKGGKPTDYKEKMMKIYNRMEKTEKAEKISLSTIKKNRKIKGEKAKITRENKYNKGVKKADKKMSTSKRRAQKRAARKKRNMAVTGIKRWDTTWK